MAIAIFDSGIGGLSVLAKAIELMPQKNYIYYADTRNVPYGTKSPQEIFNYTKNILEFFISKEIKTAIFACNTTSAVAYDELKNYFQDKIKIYPLIQSVAKSATENLKDNDTIAILATKATINSKKYNEEIKKYNPKINVVGIDCTGFVEIVENRLYKDSDSLKLIKEKLEIACENNAKRVVLGCTHYPLLKDAISAYMGENVTLINSGKEAAIYCAEVLKEKNMLSERENALCEYYVSDSVDGFYENAKSIIGREIKGNVHFIDINTYGI